MSKADSNKKVPERMCIACKNMIPKRELIRIVKSPDGVIGLDFSGKKSGRGTYICADAECIKACIKKKLINKAFKCQIDDDVYESIQKEFENSKGT